MTVTKESIRKKCKERQQSLLVLEKYYTSEKIRNRILNKEQFQNAQVIMLFMATEYEPDLQPLICLAQSLGKTVCVPLCGDSGHMAAVVPHDWESLVSNSFGIEEPKENEYTVVDPQKIDLVLVPGMAFDSQCNRLGHGQGYYDRFLKRIRPDALKMGVCFETQVYKRIPADDMDIPMDLVVTDVTTYKRTP